jgi:hypothetical protein
MCAAHAVWAAVGITGCLLLVLTGRKGHPPAVVLLPLALVAWVVGHGLIWGVLRLAATGRRLAARAAPDGQAWPLGLRLAVVCTGAAALIGVVQVVGTILARRWYPFYDAGEWAVMLAVWLVHAACFSGLLLRQRWSRLLSATLAFAWAALLGVQIAEHLAPSTSSDTMGMLIAFGLMVLLVLFGSYLVSSSRARSFLGD